MDKENRLIVLELVALLGATMEFVNDMASKAEAPEFPLTQRASAVIHAAMKRVSAAEEIERSPGLYL